MPSVNQVRNEDTMVDSAADFPSTGRLRVFHPRRGRIPELLRHLGREFPRLAGIVPKRARFWLTMRVDPYMYEQVDAVTLRIVPAPRFYEIWRRHG